MIVFVLGQSLSILNTGKNHPSKNEIYFLVHFVRICFPDVPRIQCDMVDIFHFFSSSLYSITSSTFNLYTLHIVSITSDLTGNVSENIFATVPGANPHSEYMSVLFFFCLSNHILNGSKVNMNIPPA